MLDTVWSPSVWIHSIRRGPHRNSTKRIMPNGNVSSVRTKCLRDGFALWKVPRCPSRVRPPAECMVATQSESSFRISFAHKSSFPNRKHGHRASGMDGGPSCLTDISYSLRMQPEICTTTFGANSSVSLQQYSWYYSHTSPTDVWGLVHAVGTGDGPGLSSQGWKRPSNVPRLPSRLRVVGSSCDGLPRWQKVFLFTLGGLQSA